MGTDIHQINLMIDGATMEPYDVSGETKFGESFSSAYLEELCPGRDYDLFGVLAGVRCTRFQITGNVGFGIPDEVPDDIRGGLEDKDLMLHDFVWYRLGDLRAELEWAMEKVQMYAMARANTDPEFPEFIAEGGVDELHWLLRSIGNCVKALDRLEARLKAEGRAADFAVSKVLFFFDS